MSPSLTLTQHVVLTAAAWISLAAAIFAIFTLRPFVALAAAQISAGLFHLLRLP